MNLGDIAVDVFEESVKKELTLSEFLEFLLKNNKIIPMVKEVKQQKVSGVIYVPKKYAGKRVLIIIQEDS